MEKEREILVRALVSFEPGSYKIEDICSDIRQQHPDIPPDVIVPENVIEALELLPILYNVNTHHRTARRRPARF